MSAAPGEEVFPRAGLSAPLAFIAATLGGDEIHITLPATDSVPAHEYQVHFDDPRAASF